MRKIKSSGKFSILAILLVLSLLMTTSLVFAGVDPIWDKGSLDVKDDGGYTTDTGSLTVKKQVVAGTVPDEAGFDMTVTGPAGYNEVFTLADNGSKKLSNLDAGDYTVEETNGLGASVQYSVDGGSAVSTPPTVTVTGGIADLWFLARNTSDNDFETTWTWHLYYESTGDPSETTSDEVATGTLSLAASDKYEKIYCTADDLLPGKEFLAGNYMFKVDPNPGHPGNPQMETNKISIPESDCGMASDIKVVVKNTFTDGPKAYLEVVKTSDGTAIPDNGFPYSVSGPDIDTETGVITAAGNVYGPIEVTPGNEYTITEDVTGSTGWSNTFTADNAASTRNVAGGIAVTIPEPEDEDVLVTVTINNSFSEETMPEAFLKVIKASDGTAIPENGFPYTINGEGVTESGAITETGTIYGPTKVIPGEWYTITESVTGYTGWSNTFAATGAAATGVPGDGSNGITVQIPEEFSQNVTVVVTITNSYEEEYSNRVIIKKFIDETGGSTNMTEFPVQLWFDNDGWQLYGEPFNVEKYDGKNAYIINNLPAGHYKLMELVDEVEAEDSDFNSVKYAATGPPESVGVEGSGNGAYVEFYIYDYPTPRYMTLAQIATEGPNADIIEVSITNKFDKELPPPPKYPNLVIKKDIGTGSTSQDTFTVELQQEESLRAANNWNTVATYEVPKNGSRSISIKDLLDECGPGNYRVIELVDQDNIDDWSKFKSVYFTVDNDPREEYNDKNASGPFASASFTLHEELEKDVVVTVTNNYEGGSNNGGSDPDLIIKKVIGSGSTDQDNFTVKLQIKEDGSWEDVAAYTIPKNGSKRVSLKNFDAGDYRIIETGTDEIEDLISFTYTVNGTDYDSEAPFEVVKGSSRNITVTVTNNFGDQEIITIDEPEPSTPEIITVPVELPELPKTGAAAPIAGGLGLLLAAGGLAIRRIKK